MKLNTKKTRFYSEELCNGFTFVGKTFVFGEKKSGTYKQGGVSDYLYLIANGTTTNEV